MFERFTEAARQVVVFSQEQARTLGHGYIGTEHILLGLLRKEDGAAATVLMGLGVTLERAREQVTQIVGAGEHDASGQIPFTPRAKKVLELALRESRSLGHDYIGTEHILLGLARENEGVAARILLDYGADAQTVRDEVLRVVTAGPGAPVDGPAARRDPPALDWRRVSLLWRPEGLELRVPLRLPEGAVATFAADEVWSAEPLAGLRREIWPGWLSLASPTLLEDVEPVALRRVLDESARRASAVSAREQDRVEEFLRQLRDGGA